MSRAHELFAGAAHEAVARRPARRAYDGLLARAAALNTGGGHRALSRQRSIAAEKLCAQRRPTDAAVTATAAQAHRDHAHARALTRSVLDEARADTAVPDNPIAQREAIRRRVARLRAQQAHVSAARRGPDEHRSRWRALRYRMPHHGVAPGRTAVAADEQPRRYRGAGSAVTAGPALRVGRNRTGPVRLLGVDPVVLRAGRNSLGPHHISADLRRRPGPTLASPSRRSGFPEAGHVQMAIGNNLVVEAPHSGATVRISPLGTGVQIRRPTG